MYIYIPLCCLDHDFCFFHQCIDSHPFPFLKKSRIDGQVYAWWIHCMRPTPGAHKGIAQILPCDRMLHGFQSPFHPEVTFRFLWGSRLFVLLSWTPTLSSIKIYMSIGGQNIVIFAIIHWKIFGLYSALFVRNVSFLYIFQFHPIIGCPCVRNILWFK